MPSYYYAAAASAQPNSDGALYTPYPTSIYHQSNSLHTQPTVLVVAQPPPSTTTPPTQPPPHGCSQCSNADDAPTSEG